MKRKDEDVERRKTGKRKKGKRADAFESKRWEPLHDEPGWWFYGKFKRMSDEELIEAASSVDRWDIRDYLEEVKNRKVKLPAEALQKMLHEFPTELIAYINNNYSPEELKPLANLLIDAIEEEATYRPWDFSSSDVVEVLNLLKKLDGQLSKKRRSVKKVLEKLASIVPFHAIQILKEVGEAIGVNALTLLPKDELINIYILYGDASFLNELPLDDAHSAAQMAVKLYKMLSHLSTKEEQERAQAILKRIEEKWYS